MALEVEGMKNRETHRLLSVAESGLHQNLTGLESRLVSFRASINWLHCILHFDLINGNYKEILYLVQIYLLADE